MQDGSGKPYYYHPDRGDLTQYQPPPGWVEVRQAAGGREGQRAAGRAIPAALQAANRPLSQPGTDEVLPSATYGLHPPYGLFANCAYSSPSESWHAHANGFGGFPGVVKVGLSVQAANTRKAPTCKVCGKPMKGHPSGPRNFCKTAGGLPMSSSQPQGQSPSRGDQGTPYSAAQSVSTQAPSLEGAGWSPNKRPCLGE